MDCLRHLYTLPDDVRYLNNAFTSPMSKRVQQAGRDAIDAQGDPSRVSAGDFFRPADRLRERFAALVDAGQGDSVAIVPSASYAMAIIAANLDPEPGQHIVVLGEQFPSNVYAWRRASRRTGAAVRTVVPESGCTDRGRSWNDALLDAIDADTALVSIANVHWSDGTRFDLSAVAEKCRKYGALFVVDGTQSVGAMPLSVRDLGLDALVCSGYKSMTGPYGVGLAHFGPRFHDADPIEDNWITRQGSEVFSKLVVYEDRYQLGAKKFDMGEYSSFTLLPMLAAAVDQVSEWTPEAVQRYCRNLTEPLAEAAASLGYHVEEDEFRAGHLMGIRMPEGLDTERVKSTLKERKIFVSFRGQALRVAPHVYSRKEDVDALIGVLAECVDGRVRSR